MNKTVFYKIRRLFGLIVPIYLSLAILPVQAQTTHITFALENVPMERVMNEIEKQSRYLFVNRGVDVTQIVSVHAEKQPIGDVLAQLFRSTDVNYKIEETTIVISRRDKANTKPLSIEGRVRTPAGQPIIGASIVIQGTLVGTSSDSEGRFALTVPATSLDKELTVSFLGYQTRQVPIASRTQFDVTLQESTEQIEQVVVTALGIKRAEKALSYNVQNINAESLVDVKDANFINSLTGKVAGAVINTSSSGVGGAAKVTLRGQKSIIGSSNALYVVDGIPMHNFGGGGGKEFDSRGMSESIADINPEDIESISVLTGASAAALYGSSAANGAIMITTKRGKSGKVDLTVSSSVDFLKPFVQPEFQNRYGTGYNGKADGSPIHSWGPQLNPNARMGYTPNEFLETGAVYTNSVTISGGSERNQLFFSAGTVNSDGMIPNSAYDRYNFTARNTTSLLNDKLRIDIGASYIVQRDMNMTNQGLYSNPMVPAYLFPRGDDFSLVQIFERYDPARRINTQFWPQGEGGYLRMQNPYWITYRNPRENEKKRYMLSAGLSYDFTDWLNIAGRVRVDNANNLYTRKLYATSNQTIAEGSNGHYTEARRYDAQTYADVMLNINKSWDKWSLVANVGASISDTKSDEMSYRGPIREDGLANVFNVMDLDNDKKRAEKIGWREQTQSLFASVEIGWKQMLYLTATGRNDWASQLAGSPQKAFFYPSVGLSWVPSSTFDLPKAITYLKVRASFSSVGAPFPRWITTPTYSYDPDTQQYKPTTHRPIGQLYPERTKTWEVGIDTRLWRDLSLSLSYYCADTDKQTFQPTTSASTGYGSQYVQTGSVRNQGFEGLLGYSHTWRNFAWESNFTYGWNKNQILELAYNVALTGDQAGTFTSNRFEIKGLGKAKYILKPGGSMGDLYTSAGLVRNDKGMIEIDESGSPITADNLKEMRLGSVFPDHNMAWRNDFAWKGLRLGVLISARIGGIVFSSTQAYLDEFGVSESSAADRDRGYSLVEGLHLDPQKWYAAIAAQGGLPQYYTYSATNVRLQELSFGYTLPRKWFRNKMSLSVNFVARNLWMIYCKAPFDPESVASTENFYQGVDYFMNPTTRNLGFNVRLKF